MFYKGNDGELERHTTNTYLSEKLHIFPETSNFGIPIGKIVTIRNEIKILISLKLEKDNKLFP